MNSVYLILKNKLRRKELDNLNNFSLKFRPELKKYKFSKNIEKPLYRRVAQKRYNFAPGAANHTFFLTHPVSLSREFLCTL